MVPTEAFPPGAEQGYAPFLEANPEGLIDTGLACRRRLDTNTLTMSAPLPGITTIGGFRLQESVPDEAVAAVDPEATVVALPDATLGQRLAGSARDRAAMVAALQEAGANPLIAEAFRRRAPSEPA
jgi:hypothetical protein